MPRIFSLFAVLSVTLLFPACETSQSTWAARKVLSPREIELVRELIASIEAGWPEAMTIHLPKDVDTEKEASLAFKKFLHESPFLRGTSKNLSLHPVLQTKDYFFTGIKNTPAPAFLFIRKGQRTVYLIYMTN